MNSPVPSETVCWCVDNDNVPRAVCDSFEENDRGECRFCGHRRECHGNP